MGISPILHCNLNTEIIDSKKSIELFMAGANNNYLPGRLDHFAITIRTLVVDKFSIYRRVGKLAINALCIVASPVTQPGWNVFLYRMIRLVGLDPLDILAGKAVLIVHAVSSILGILSPSFAYRGWVIAEHLEMFNVSLNASLWESFVQVNEKTPYRTAKIIPFNAEVYFGEKRCHSIQHTLRPENRRIQLTEQATNALASYIEEVIKTTKKFNECFTVTGQDVTINEILNKVGIQKPNAFTVFLGTPVKDKLNSLTLFEKGLLFDHVFRNAETLEKRHLPENAAIKLAELEGEYGSVRYYQTCANYGGSFVSLGR